MLRLGVIGLGHWGPNYLRIFSGFENASVVACADTDESRLANAHKIVPQARLSRSSKELIDASDIDALIIATPTGLHYEMGRQALLAGKHVLMEKPLALSSRDAMELAQLADSQKRILMVGHTFLFNPGVLALRDLLDKGHLGKLLYLNLVRANLGPIRQDVNALIDLAPHDISILLFLLGKMPETISAQGASYLDPKREDVVFVTLRFPGNVMAQIHVSWLEPVKVRRVTAIGDRKMAVFNDIDVVEPIRIYDKGVSLTPRNYSDFTEFRIIIRDGDVVSPKITFFEPLKTECTAFVEAIQTGRTPLSDGPFGVQVVKVLEAAQESLKDGGKRISLIA
jgi:predicted dehydrogenase